MGGSAPAVPTVTVPPPIPAIQSPVGAQAMSAVTTRAQSAVGPSATIATSPNGLSTPATTGTKTLLGS